ncbi:MAG: PD-(D/E)XK nuclease family protein, partial [Veillonella sp.]|nr:PD-(D/E)XK nuclease family protein [Veillonella sp.]
LFEVVRFNYNHDSLFRLLKTDLVPMGDGLDLADSRARVDQLENYCLEFGIHHYKWSMPSWPWCRKGKDGKSYSPQEEERLAQVNESHNYLMAWLEDWFDFASHKDSQTGIAGHTGRQWAHEIINLLEGLGVPETLYDWAQEAERQGQPVEKVSHEQMYKKVLAFLDELVNLSGDEVLSLPEMALLLEEALGDINYSMVPPSLDHVLVTTVERGYTQERKHVFVMGLNDGLFPRKMGEEGLIKDKDRSALAEAGIHLAGGALTQAFNENFLFYLACTRATHSLTLSYANASGEGEPQEPSLVMKRLASLGYTQEAHKVPLHIEEGTETAYMWRPNQSLSLLSSQWGNLLGGASLAQPWWALYEWALASQEYRPRLQQVTQGLFDNNEVPVLEPAVVRGLFLPHQYMTGSVTRLEKYEACPFKFLAEYGFKLQARKVASYGAPEIGTLLHDHLRALGEELLQEGRQWRDLGPEEQKERCQAIASHVMDESLLGYNNVTDAAYDKARYDRLVKTLEATVARLVDWSSKSDFSMTALEKSFGMHDEWPSVDVPLGKGQVLKLQGQIDRIDTWEDQGTTYGLIMDYKTGSAGISGGQLYYGLKLQLLTYWLAYKHVKGHEHIVPAGTIYTPVKNAKLSVSTPMSKEEAAHELATSSEFRSFGYFTDTPDVLMHMDALKADNKAGLYVPIRISSKGINGQDKWRTKSVGDYDIMADYVTHKMAQTGQGIGAGQFPVSPYMYKKKNACSFCDYKSVCRFESRRNSYNYLPDLTEEEALNKMREALGIQVKEEGGEA